MGGISNVSRILFRLINLEARVWNRLYKTPENSNDIKLNELFASGNKFLEFKIMHVSLKRKESEII